MNPETIEILEQYALGTLLDPEQQEWIERELDRDAELAEKFCTILNEVTPPSLPQIRGMFGGLECSVWAVLPSPEGSATERRLETVLQLPSEPPMPVVVQESPSGLRLEFAAPSPGWRPMSLTVFRPQECTWQPIVLRGDAVVAPELASRPHWSKDDRTTPVSLSLSGYSESRWESDAHSNEAGGCAWLADTLAAGLVVRCTSPADALPLGRLRYRLRRRPVATEAWRETCADFPEPMHDEETLRTEVPLGVQRAAELQRSPWEVVVESIGVQEVPYLQAKQFRALAGPEVQVLPLVPAGAGDSCLGCEAKFVSPAQHALWNEAGICRAMRWEPVGGGEGQRR